MSIEAKFNWDIKKIDSHRHRSKTKIDIINISKSANKLNLEKIVLFGSNNVVNGEDFDAIVWEIYQKNKDLVIPFAANFNYSDECVTYVKECLDKGFYGLGELLLGHDGVKKLHETHNYDDENLIKIYNLASTAHAPVLVHCDPFQIKQFLNAVEICKNTTFIWAHLAYDFPQGMHYPMTDPKLIEHYINKYSNLMFDISFWKKSAKCLGEDGYIDLLEKYNNRFIFGMDITKDYEETQDIYFEDFKFLFNELSNAAIENIFYNNMNNLIEKRKQMIK